MLSPLALIPKHFANKLRFWFNFLLSQVHVDEVVYQCSSADFVDSLCGDPSYKPGDSLHWEMAWIRLGSCNGKILNLINCLISYERMSKPT